MVTFKQMQLGSDKTYLIQWVNKIVRTNQYKQILNLDVHHDFFQEEENVELHEKLEQTESMKRRLNDHVTELQGQLVMERRSQLCSIQ